MPTFYNYALNDMEESQINDAKRRVTGYNTNQTERLSSKPAEDPTNGLIDIQLSRLTDEIYLVGKEIDNLDSYLQIDTSLIVMNAGVPSTVKKTIQDSVKIYISINQSVEKIRRTYRNLSKNIKFTSLQIWTDFTGAVEIMFKQNLVLNDIVDRFVNDYRAAVGQPPVDIRRPDRIEEDEPPPDDDDGGDGDGGDGDGGDEAPAPPPPDDDPTDPEPDDDDRTIEDEEERQDIEGVDSALPLPPRSRSSEVREQQLRDLEKLEAETPKSSDSSSSSSSGSEVSNSSQINYRLSQIERDIQNNLERQAKIEEAYEDEDIDDSGIGIEWASLEKEFEKLFKEKSDLLRDKKTLEGLPLPSPLPTPPKSQLTRFPLRTDPVPQRAISESGSPRPPPLRREESEDVDYTDAWPDLVDSTPRTNVWPTIAGLAEDALTMDDVEDMLYWPDIADQEGFKQRFLANRQTRSLGKMVGNASEAYAAAWKTLAGSRSPRTFAEFLGKEKNKKQTKFLVDKALAVGKRRIVRV